MMKMGVTMTLTTTADSRVIELNINNVNDVMSLCRNNRKNKMIMSAAKTFTAKIINWFLRHYYADLLVKPIKKHTIEGTYVKLSAEYSVYLVRKQKKMSH